MDLRFVGAGAHDPFAIFADAYTLTGFFKLEVLEQLDPVGIFGVLLSLFLLRQPVRKAS